MGGDYPRRVQTVTQENRTTQATPFGAAGPALNDLLQRAQSALAQTNGTFYGGDFFAGPTADAGAGVNMIRNALPGMGTGVDLLRGMGTSMLAGDYLNPNSNPALRGAMDAAVAPLRDQLTNTILPNIKDAAISQGAYGGSRQDLQENSALTNFARTAGEITAPMALTAYEAERGRQMQAPGLLSAANALSLMPGQTSLALDEAQRGLTQIGLNNEQARFGARQAAPWYGLGQMQQILNAAVPYAQQTSSGTSTSNAPNPNYVSPDIEILRSLLGGAGIASSLFSAPAGGTSAFAGISSALAPLLAMSERRLKKNIERLEGGRWPWYRFEYVWGGPPQIGHMADEVPEKARRNIAGLIFVDYGVLYG